MIYLDPETMISLYKFLLIDNVTILFFLYNLQLKKTVLSVQLAFSVLMTLLIPMDSCVMMDNSALKDHGIKEIVNQVCNQ